MIWLDGLVLMLSFAVAVATLRLLLPRLQRANIVGRDVQKPDKPLIPEMGGLAIVAGFVAALVAIAGVKVFFEVLPQVELVDLLAVLVTVLLIALLGFVDDLITVKQIFKALMPLFAALPLAAVNPGYTILNLPLLGYTDFGLFYPLLLVPLGITGAVNATNMLAGFNGVEAGMGAVAFLSLTIVALSLGEHTAALVLLAALGGTLACLWFNWFPARVFVGDVGTLTIGAVLASAVILGNFEMAGVLLVLPHLVDFFFKASGGFPKTFGVYRDGKLHCPDAGPAGLGQWVMKLCGGIKERNLTLVLIGLEVLMGLAAVGFYARF